MMKKTSPTMNGILLLSATLLLSPSAWAQRLSLTDHDITTATKDVSSLPSVEEIGHFVDTYSKNLVPDEADAGGQLNKTRVQDAKSVDACAKNPGQKTFMDAIEGAVEMSITPRRIYTNGPIDEGYGLPGRDNSYPVSLVSHPLCQPTKDSLRALLGANRIPDDDAIKTMTDFVRGYNYYRDRVQANKPEAVKEFSLYASTMMGCLAYSESLTTPGDSGPDKDKYDASFNTFINSKAELKNAFTDKSGQPVARPAGVIYSEDHDGEFFVKLIQSKKDGTFTPDYLAKLQQQYPAWMVTGLYQFTPKLSGNADTCVAQWNDANPACHINTESIASIASALGSSGQTFNAYCGAQKIVQSFNSQVNTVNTTGTDITNVLPDGTLKAPEDRCVSPFAQAGKNRVYTHFGPLRNSVGFNLKKLMSCVSGSFPPEFTKHASATN